MKQLLYMKNILQFTALAAVVSLCGCADTEDRVRESDRNLQNSRQTFIYNMIPEGGEAQISDEYSQAVNNFSVSLLSTVYADSFKGKNIVLSPFSLSRNLSVLTEGASGNTKEELLTALGGEVVLNDARAALGELLYADKSVILQCADALWVDWKFTLKQSFYDRVTSHYGVEVASLPEKDPKDTINQWISDNTNGKIRDLLKAKDLNDTTAMVLVNAIYFEADWESPFDVLKTERKDFYTGTSTVAADMMVSNYLHDTRKTDTYENAKIYYGTSGKKYFYLDLYKPTTISVEEFLNSYCSTALTEISEMQRGALEMPRFHFNSEVDLIPSLKSMGITDVFEKERSKLTEMTEREDDILWVEMIKQKAGIKTDEEGTTAYAATVSAVGGATSIPDDSPDVVLDNPFVYFIRGGNGLILFAGVVHNPNLSE